MSQMLAFSIVAFILFVGEAVSTATKAWVPSVFVSAVLFLIGYWTFFPSNIVELAGMPVTVAHLCMYLLIANMGTMISIKELKSQWRTIVIAVVGIIGIVASLLTLGVFLFDWQTMITAIPPLVGGIVSALIMKDAALANGYETLAVLAIAIYVMQGFAGYPLTSLMLKRESREVLEKIRAGTWKPAQLAQESAGEVKDPAQDPNNLDALPKLFNKIPDRFNGHYFKLFRLGVTALGAYLTSKTLAPIVDVNVFVLCLVFGVIGASVGWLEREPLQKANSFGLCVLVLMAFVFDGLKDATPAMLIELAWPLFAIIVIGVTGMYITSWICAKLLKISPRLAFSVSLTALYGFPADYIITKEVIDSVTDDPQEREHLMSYLMPPMLIGGFITVTITSVVLAGIFTGLY